MWDFWPLSPESLHQVTWLMGDRGLPISPMHMNGYGSHAYSFINAKGERCWVKFHFKTQQGIKFYTNCEVRLPFMARSKRATSRNGRCSCRSCRKPMLTSIGTIPSTSPRYGLTAIIH
jgi:hypothetical protein